MRALRRPRERINARRGGRQQRRRPGPPSPLHNIVLSSDTHPHHARTPALAARSHCLSSQARAHVLLHEQHVALLHPVASSRRSAWTARGTLAHRKQNKLCKEKNRRRAFQASRPRSPHATTNQPVRRVLGGTRDQSSPGKRQHGEARRGTATRAQQGRVDRNNYYYSTSRLNVRHSSSAHAAYHQPYE